MNDPLAIVSKLSILDVWCRNLATPLYKVWQAFDPSFNLWNLLTLIITIQHSQDSVYFLGNLMFSFTARLYLPFTNLLRVFYNFIFILTLGF